MKRRGVIQAARPRKNEFHLGPAVRGYLQYKCGCASESEADYHRERALKERANRQLREILLEQTRDQLHDAQAVQFLVQDGNSQIRSQLLAFGDRLALQLAGKNPAEIKALIDHQIRKVLNELRQYDPRGYCRWQSKIALSSTGPRDAEPQLGEGSGEKEQPARGRPGWPKGRARPKGRRPWAAEANRRRWQSDPGYRRLHRSWSRDCHLSTSAMVAVPPCFSTTTAIAMIYRSDRNKLIPSRFLSRCCNVLSAKLCLRQNWFCRIPLDLNPIISRWISFRLRR